jgi:hypothetical protein
MDRLSHNARLGDDSRVQALAELRAIRERLEAIYELLDEFVRVFLHAKFPYGKPTDRWERPRG